MTHKTHSSWKRFRPKRAVPAKDPQQALAEGLRRPAPGLTPPMTYDEHFDAKVEAVREAENADQTGEQDPSTPDSSPE